MAFTDTKIRDAKKQFVGQNKIIYGGTRLGLALHLGRGGTTAWYLHYRSDGRPAKIKLGLYPWIGIAEAQRLALEQREQIERGIDPAAKKKSEKEKAEFDALTFGAEAEKWFADRYVGKAPRTIESVRTALDRDILPWLGNRPIISIQTADLADCIDRVLERGARQSAARMKGYFSQIFKRAIRRRIVGHNIAADLETVSLPKAKHMPAIIEPRDVGGLIRAIRAYEGTYIVKCALELAPLVFLRPMELRFLHWADFDFADRLCTIPGERMKMRRDHVVPLSSQAIGVLDDLYQLNGRGKLVFASTHHPTRPIGRNSLNGALERLDLKGIMTSHGFRSTASTLLRKLGFSKDVIEKQLAHQKNDVEHAYNRYEYLDERRAMMQRWADYLDELAAGGKIIAFPQQKVL